ncbi:ankyrin repeat domain-containing protein [Endozoicomonas ascidiicola]|uniref:ankyrin repeat domain-containing protein n=1 Tax=Endozoicomonas ascidiicola TaxID=1698521 RepID=UPI00082BCB1B|nr:ankyrin repeat domain-containing protein [Endozoicomonas ascidiicola]
MRIEGPDRTSSQPQPEPENHGQQNRRTNKSRNGGFGERTVNNQPGSPVDGPSLQARTVRVNAKNQQPSIAPKPLTIELTSTPSHSDAVFLQELEKIFEEKGQDGLAINKEGMHPLHYAAKEGLIHSVKYLLDNGDAQQLIGLKNEEQNNLVHLAAIAGHADLLQWLSGQYGVDALMAKGNRGFTALHFAAKEGHLSCVERLLDASPDSVHIKEDDGSNAMHWAAWAGNLDVLKCMVERNGKNIFSEKGNEGANSLHFAVQNNHLECVQYILEIFHALQYEVDEFGQSPIHRAAIKGHEQCVAELLKTGEDLQKLTDSHGNTAVHLAAAFGKLEVMNCISKHDSETLKAKNNNGNTPLHLAASNGHVQCVAELLKTGEDLQKLTDSNGCTAAHLAAAYGQLEVMNCISKHDSETLKAKNNYGYTPLHLAVENKRPACVKEILSHNTVNKNLNRIDLFGDMFSNDAEIMRLLVDARKKNGAKRISWSTADSKPSIQQRKPKNELDEWALFDADAPPAKRERIGQSDEWPMMEDRKNGLSSLATKAGAVLSYVKRVGIYLFNPVYLGETKEKFQSMGDLNGGVQMAKMLESMGAQSLDVVLSPPDLSPWSERSAYSESQKREYAEKQKVTRYKLALLWPEFDPAKPLPQTVMMGKCEVTFRDCDDQQLKPAPVMFSFINADQQCREVKDLPDSVITLKPYRFRQYFVSITTDIQENRGNVLPVSRPENSIIPEIEHSSSVKPGVIKSQPLETVINQLNEKSISGELNLSVVYGLYRYELSSESRGAILDQWISNIEAYSEQSVNKKPAIIAVASNVILEASLKQYAEGNQLTLIDLGAIVRASDDQAAATEQAMTEQINQLSPGKPAICILPSLPKHKFDELVLSSRLPTLAEGANLTSFLLQHGRPHLSVLPSGDTPVAQDMGDPFEAMKAEAFSYKLVINENEREVLEWLTSLVKDGKDISYRTAIVKIAGLDKQEVPNLAFLWKQPQQSTFLELEQLTVMKLLKKGYAGKLGETGRKALLSILDPSPQAFEQYTRDAMNKDSATARHFELQKMHVNGPSLNAVTSALVQLGKYKGVI